MGEWSRVYKGKFGCSIGCATSVTSLRFFSRYWSYVTEWFFFFHTTCWKPVFEGRWPHNIENLVINKTFFSQNISCGIQDFVGNSSWQAPENLLSNDFFSRSTGTLLSKGEKENHRHTSHGRKKNVLIVYLENKILHIDGRKQKIKKSLRPQKNVIMVHHEFTESSTHTHPRKKHGNNIWRVKNSEAPHYKKRRLKQSYDISYSTHQPTLTTHMYVRKLR